MFSSSAKDGYLSDLHTNFTASVELNNMHTDTYGDFRNPPMQGPFADDMVGGEPFRHQEIGSTTDRQEGFVVAAQTGTLSVSSTGRPVFFRDAYAKRPLNIRNIKTNSPGNYSQEYEVVQLAGRTLNPRHFAEFPGQYTTDYPLHLGTEGRVLNTLNAAGQPATGTLPDYTMPDNTGSYNNFIFVNKFSAPGSRYTMSRGFLNPIGEEMSAYNAIPFRNLNVRGELSEDLARHTPKATDIPPGVPTKYHTTNRNPRLYKTLTSSSDVISSSWDYTSASALPGGPDFPEGCTDANACNYTVNATVDDGSCLYPPLDCGYADVVTDKFVYDNGYVTHAIPQSTLQYSWITASAETTQSEFPGFATGSDIAFYSGTIDFTTWRRASLMALLPNGIAEEPYEYKWYFNAPFAVTSALVTDEPAWMSYVIDYAGQNITFSGSPTLLDVGDTTITVDMADGGGGTDAHVFSVIINLPSPHILNNVYIDPDTAVQSFDFFGAAYTYNSWKEIRGGELRLSRYYREHNILPITKSPTTQYIEPPVVAKHMPMEHELAIDTTGTPFLLSTAYGNELTRYSNDEINQLYNFRVSDKKTKYAELKKLYLDESGEDPNNPVKGFISLTYGQTLWPKDENAFMKKVRVRGNYSEVAGTGPRGYDKIYGTQNTIYKTTEMRSLTGALNSQGYEIEGEENQSNALAFDPMRSDGYASLPVLPAPKNVGELNSDTDRSMTQAGGSEARPALAFLETNNIGVDGSFSDYSERLIEQMSGKTRWYNTYSDYNNNMKGLLQGTSILPEFRISEHMDYYISEQGGNFRAENKDFLTLLGANYTSSADSPTSTTFNVDFENTYLSSEEFDHLKKIRDDHLEFANPKQIKLRASGIKRLLPYNGFYPDTRTVQLGNLLSESLSNNVAGYLYDAAKPEAVRELAPAQGWQSFLKTFSSPGILYNSIKSGLAVDYPIYTSNPLSGSSGSVANPLYIVPLSSAANIRLPFETLYNFNENLPKSTDFFNVSSIPGSDNPDHFSASIKYYSKWDGKKKPNFELASHNFLAESVNFFLEGGELNSFTSAPELQFSEVEVDKTYYMDIVLRDEVGMSKNVEYHGEADFFPVNEVVTEGMSVSATDPDADITTLDQWSLATSVIENPAGGAYVLATSKYHPTSSFVGRAMLLSVDEAGNVIDLDPGDMLTGSAAGGDSPGFGQSCAMVSSSDGLIFAIGAVGENIGYPPGEYGAAYFYKYDGTSISLLSRYEPTGSRGYGATMSVSSGSDGVIFASSGFTDSSGISTLPDTTVFLHNYDTASPLTASLLDTCTVVDVSSAEASAVCLTSCSSSEATVVAFKGTDGTAVNPEGAIRILTYTGASFFESVNYTSSVPDLTVINSLSITPFYTPASLPFTAFDADTLLAYGANITSGEGKVCFVRVASNGAWATSPGTMTISPEQYDIEFGKYISLETKEDDDIEHNSYLAIGSTGTDVDALTNAGSITLYEITMAAGYVAAWPSLSQGLSGSILQRVYARNDYQQFSGHYGSGVDMAIGSSGDINDVYISAGSSGYDYAPTDPEVVSAGGMVQLTYRAQRATNYRIHGSLYGMPIDGLYDPAYCQYTPPGFYGESIARLSYSSSVGGPISLDEILRAVKVENILTLDPTRVRTEGGEPAIMTNTQEATKTTVSASVQLYGKILQKDIQFSISEDGDSTIADRATAGSAENLRWAIATKYECPVVNNSSSAYLANYSSHVTDLEDDPVFQFTSGTAGWKPPRSVWTSYGQPVQPDKGYEFELRESFAKRSVNTLTTGSLIDVCGFTPGTKKVGTVADKKDISEAIMVIPYVDKAIPYKTVEIDKGKHFIRFSKTELKKQKKNLEDKGYAISEDIRETSISETIQAMKKYVVPPQYDFLKYDDIKTFVSYFLEFDHVLSQRDLIDIWQGVTPAIAANPETDEIEITHGFDQHNFFHNVEFPTDIKFMVFKVKQMAKWNYYETTTDSSDDNRFKFNFQGDGQTEVIPSYNYNWPYDFCSLVERAKVDVSVVFKKDDEDTG